MVILLPSFKTSRNISILFLGRKEKLWNSMSLIAQHSSEVIIEDCEDPTQGAGESPRSDHFGTVVLFSIGLVLYIN